MTMSRKHFEAIATTIKSEVTALERDGEATGRQSEYSLRINGAYIIAKHLCSTFQNDNPRFDEDRFLAACGF